MSSDRVYVAMSGGVDSSVAALLLRQAGHRLFGVHLRLLHNEDPGLTGEGACCSQEDAEDAGLVARRLGFPYYVFDFSDVFQAAVIRNFVREYQQGRTPNPCAVCNRTVKFGALLDRVRLLGGDYLATGHYARVEYDETCGRYLLKRGLDRRKDQSYFLYMLTQDQLSHVLFPLGELNKSQVRQLAESHGLVNARKRDSQDICFVPGGDYVEFLQNCGGATPVPGDLIDSSGRVLGRHRGQACYTIGQRKGLGVSAGAPLYVLRKDPVGNTVTLGPDSALYTGELTAEHLNWIAIPALDAPITVTVKTRHSPREASATVEPLSGGLARVLFREPQRAVTPGQSVVFYDGEVVVGGGTICE